MSTPVTNINDDSQVLHGKAAPKRRSRPHFRMRSILVVISVIAAGWYFWTKAGTARADTAGGNIAKAGNGASEGWRADFTGCCGTRAAWRYRRLHHRPWKRDAHLYRHGQDAGRRANHGRQLQRGRNRATGRATSGNRLAPYKAQLEQYQGQLKRDQALLANAKVDFARYATLMKTNAVPEQTYATQQATVNQDEGQVEMDKGLIDATKLNITYCHITSPITGRIGLRLVDPGNYVQASSGTALLVITQSQPISIIFPIAEDQLPRCAVALKLRPETHG